MAVIDLDSSSVLSSNAPALHPLLTRSHLHPSQPWIPLHWRRRRSCVRHPAPIPLLRPSQCPLSYSLWGVTCTQIWTYFFSAAAREDPWPIRGVVSPFSCSDISVDADTHEPGRVCVGDRHCAPDSDHPPPCVAPYRPIRRTAKQPRQCIYISLRITGTHFSYFTSSCTPSPSISNFLSAKSSFSARFRYSNPASLHRLSISPLDPRSRSPFKSLLRSLFNGSALPSQVVYLLTVRTAITHIGYGDVRRLVPLNPKACVMLTGSVNSERRQRVADRERRAYNLSSPSTFPLS